MRLVAILSVILVAAIPTAIFAEENLPTEETVKKSKYTKFQTEFCKDISKHPSITVCISNGDKDDHYKLKNKHLRRFKREAKKVLAQYKKFQMNFDLKYNKATSSCTYDDWDPAECDLEGGNRSFCEVEVGVPPGD